MIQIKRFLVALISTLALLRTSEAQIVGGNCSITNGVFSVDINLAVNSANAVTYNLTATGLPLNTNYSYHVHVFPVVNASCPSTGGHYNPLNATAGTVVPGNITTYEKGDLSGKWGLIVPNMNGTYQISVVDPTLSMADLVDRSIVVHNATSSARLACANIILFNGTVNSAASKEIPTALSLLSMILSLLAL